MASKQKDLNEKESIKSFRGCLQCKYIPPRPFSVRGGLIEGKPRGSVPRVGKAGSLVDSRETGLFEVC